MTIMSIQSVQRDELPALARIAGKTFRQTFASSNDPKDFEAYLSKAFAQEQLSIELNDHETSFSFAKVDGKIVGYLKTNRGGAQTEKVEGQTLEIERIYVDADVQGSGVGKALFEHALEEAQTIGSDAIWLGVWEENPKAIEFYARQGFRAFGEHEFRIGSDVQRDILMRREL
jgi:ribosomal protein S18 acetylase RimI-like enzyme